MAKNCHTCKWMEWVDGEESDPAGWTCNNRIETVALLRNLDREEYRNRYKRCYEAQAKENDRG